MSIKCPPKCLKGYKCVSGTCILKLPTQTKKTNPPKLHEFKRSGLLAWIKEREREKERGKKSSSKASTLSSSAGFFDRDKTLSPRLEGSAHNHLLPSFWIPFFAFGNVFKVRLN